MRTVCGLLLLPLLMAADDRWTEFRSGPFQVMTDAGERPGRETLAQLEQLRWAIGAILGKQEPVTVWPVRIAVLKKWDRPAGLKMGRDAWLGAMAAAGPIPRALLHDCARLLIDDNAARMPLEIESGLADLYSTMELDGASIVIGRPLPASERNLNWARIHLLSVSPNYYGKMRVLLYNLQHGSEPEPAFRNTFGKGPAEIDKEAAAYLAAGNFPTAEVSGKPLNPRRDFSPEQQPTGPRPEIGLADLLEPAAARGAYEAVLKKSPGTPEALEGLGLVALAERNPDAARKYFQQAAEAGSKNPRVYLELGRLGKDRSALEKAAQLNPNWAESQIALAGQESDGRKKLEYLRAATRLEPRNARYWQALAEACLKLNLYPEAGKAWAAARHASIDEAERQRIIAAERAIERQRLDYEAAERKRAEEEKQREIARLKAEALADVRAAEARANRAAGEYQGQKVEQWFEGETPAGKVRGRLTQIDCLKAGARLVVQGDGGKLTRLMVRDPGKVVVLGGGTLDLGCGAQRPGRNVSIEYFPKSDPKLATAGDVATIEYK